MAKTCRSAACVVATCSATQTAAYQKGIREYGIVRKGANDYILVDVFVQDYRKDSCKGLISTPSVPIKWTRVSVVLGLHLSETLYGSHGLKTSRGSII
jgi:hypothetical protein